MDDQEEMIALIRHLLEMPLEVFYCFCQYLDASPDEILYGPGGPPPRAH